MKPFFKSLGDNVGTVLYERLSSPFFQSFIVSWVYWNWDILYYLASKVEDKTILERINHVKNSMMALDSILWNPLKWSFAFLLGYILLSSCAFFIWELFVQSKRFIRGRISGWRPLDKEDERTLRETIIRLEGDKTELTNKFGTERLQLEIDLNKVTSEKLDLERENNELKENQEKAKNEMLEIRKNLSGYESELARKDELIKSLEHGTKIEIAKEEAAKDLGFLDFIYFNGDYAQRILLAFDDFKYRFKGKLHISKIELVNFDYQDVNAKIEHRFVTAKKEQKGLFIIYLNNLNQVDSAFEIIEAINSMKLKHKFEFPVFVGVNALSVNLERELGLHGVYGLELEGRTQNDFTNFFEKINSYNIK